ncbi:TIGR04222 domain-containing membrane protein [Saccharothrix deserti]|uniref:TIGR04222 domain-containing membrane protein n=1 Tax=Saccharothrix deserti TaxID=2593674 RepID=UPI00131BCCA9|nr:TIGR04222 domain-containing membrane protein [Saccharothrix deserti]
MERPWGLSGPEFLELYWIALAVSLAFAILVRVRLRGTRGGAPAGALDLTLLDIAYLTGGPRRVVETSVAGLISSGALVPARNGAVRIVGSPVADHPVDQAVLADVNRYRYRTSTLLITSVSEQDAPRAIGRRLSEMDYLVTPERAKSRLRVGVVPMALLLAVGLLRWVNGLAIGAPVGWLTLQLVLTGVLIVLLLKANPLTRTAKGRKAVAKARAGEFTGGVGRDQLGERRRAGCSQRLQRAPERRAARRGAPADASCELRWLALGRGVHRHERGRRQQLRQQRWEQQRRRRWRWGLRRWRRELIGSFRPFPIAAASGLMAPRVTP